MHIAERCSYVWYVNGKVNKWTLAPGMHVYPWKLLIWSEPCSKQFFSWSWNKVVKQQEWWLRSQKKMSDWFVHSCQCSAAVDLYHFYYKTKNQLPINAQDSFIAIEWAVLTDCHSVLLCIFHDLLYSTGHFILNITLKL